MNAPGCWPPKQFCFKTGLDAFLGIMPPKLQIRKRHSGLVKEIGRITISFAANAAKMQMMHLWTWIKASSIGDNTAGGVTGYIKAILANKHSAGQKTQ